MTIVKPGDMINTFIHEARQASERAKQNNALLLLLVFCHELPNVQLLLNDGDRERGMSITYLRGALEPGASVSLISAACYLRGLGSKPGV